jgi:peptidoglycan/xylan/chitin deacetylase (PgdA/CDA1 family)
MLIFSFLSNVDSLDWQGLSASEILNKVCNHKLLGPGAIILCHNGAEHTAEALDEMLTNLKSQGYEIVPISGLIIRENFHMDATGKQIAD